MQINLYNKKIIKASPFMKWVGGKRQLIPEIEKRLPSSIKSLEKLRNILNHLLVEEHCFFI